MRLSEITLPRLFHGSRKRFPKGFVLRPQSDGYISFEEVKVHEAVMDHFRPVHCLPRSKSVFMVADPAEIDYAGGYEDNVYEVQPQGKVEKNDMAWYSELGSYTEHFDEQGQIDLNDPEIMKAATNYWNGVPYKNPANSLWEYRSESAIVLRRIRYASK